MCPKGSCAEGRVAVPTGRLCQACPVRDEVFACFGTLRSGPGRGPESPTAGPPSVPPGRPHPRECRQARGGRPETAGPSGATPKPIAGCFMRRGCSMKLSGMGGLGTWPEIATSRPVRALLLRRPKRGSELHRPCAGTSVLLSYALAAAQAATDSAAAQWGFPCARPGRRTCRLGVWVAALDLI